MELDWGLIHARERASADDFSLVPSGSKRGTFQLHNLFMNTKSKFYNLCRPMCRTLPPFSNSPIYLLGKTYAPDNRPGSNGSHAEQEGEKKTAEENSTWLKKLKKWDEWIDIIDREPKEKPPDPKHPAGLPRFVQEFLADFSSKIWLTYRNEFPPIKPTHFTTDTGWGCMLRTAQMLLAQAFVCHYLDREWRVQSGEHLHLYRQLIRWFADDPGVDSPYSLHKIVHVAAVYFNKRVGEWFEPTTILHSLQILVQEHAPDRLRMYVPHDAVVSIADVEEMCLYRAAHPSPISGSSSSSSSSTNRSESKRSSRSRSPHRSLDLESPLSSPSSSPLVPLRESTIDGIFADESSDYEDDDDDYRPVDRDRNHPAGSSDSSSSFIQLSSSGSFSRPGVAVASPPSASYLLQMSSSSSNPSSSSSSSSSASTAAATHHRNYNPQVTEKWRPVVVLIPVRLGVECLNPIYIESLKRFFAFPQSLGIIGGKPHSSYYFVGCQDDTVFYLDPHIVNTAVDTHDEDFNTETYHTNIPQAMPFKDIDPTLALGFYCKNRADFEDFCNRASAVAAETDCVVFSITEQPAVYRSPIQQLYAPFNNAKHNHVTTRKHMREHSKRKEQQQQHRVSAIQELQNDDEVVWI